ncbi:MAG TPA: hypothetical protein VL221_10450 [Bacteroidota bacterium]|nr:hypothetical protein [Bacteroidota bacterium]
MRLTALFYGATALLCTRIPLLDYLGYEFSALIALASSWCAAFLTVRAVTDALASPGDLPPARAAARAVARSAAANELLLLIPLAVMTLNALAVRNCSMAQGLAFFTLLPGVSVLFGVAVGFFAAALTVRGRAVVLCIYAALLAYSFGLGYFTPAVFSYNFLYGYFPGLTYDEALGVTRTLVLFRAATLFVASVFAWEGMIVLADGEGRRGFLRGLRVLWSGLIAPHRRVRAAAVVLALAGLYLFRCDLGFESTSAFIRRTLGGELRTEHFVLYYSPSSFTPVELEQTAREHEFRLVQVRSALGLADGRVLESYIYPSPEMKQRLIGAGNTDIAKPWSGQIHISRQSLEGSLKHELVHVAAAPLGVPVIGASLSTGLVEGLAMAVDREWGNRTLHEYAAMLSEAGIAPPIEEIMSPWGFAAHQSSMSYVLAGSFCRYLIDRYGMHNMALLYRSLDYRGIYGRSLAGLAREWGEYLDDVQLYDEDQDCVDALFRRGTIFTKVCARVLAERSLEARRAFAGRDFAVAESLFARVWAAGRGIDALGGYLGAALRLGRTDVLTSVMDTVVLADDRPARYLALFLPIGDAYWVSGDREKAYALYDRVYQADLAEGYTEAAALRLLAMEADPRGRIYLPLFMADVSDSSRVAVIDSLTALGEGSRILEYMKGRALLREGDFQEVVATLQKLDLTDDDLDLEALRLRYLGQALYRLGRYAEARNAFWISLNADDADIAEEKMDTWIDRCEWAERRGD